MTRYPAIRALMFAFAMLGLLLGPMAVSMSGMAMAQQDMSAMAAMDSMTEPSSMPEAMPCCPEKQVENSGLLEGLPAERPLSGRLHQRFNGGCRDILHLRPEGPVPSCSY